MRHKKIGYIPCRRQGLFIEVRERMLQEYGYQRLVKDEYIYVVALCGLSPLLRTLAEGLAREDELVVCKPRDISYSTGAVMGFVSGLRKRGVKFTALNKKGIDYIL